MINGKKIIPMLLIATFFSCLAGYLVLPQPIKWAITSPIDVTMCTARVADKLGIQSNFAAIKSYILQSVEIGMTPDEVMQTLSQVGSLEVAQTFVDEERKTHTQLLLRLCDNPFGNIVLFLYYSEDGHLLKVVDAHAE